MNPYMRAAGHVLGNAVFAFGVSVLLDRWFAIPSMAWPRRVVSLGGIVLLLIVGLAKLGWNRQTWSGDSQIERYHHRNFLIFSHAGMFLQFLSWHWSTSSD